MARALIGVLGNDDFSFKVWLDGLNFFEAIRIDRTSGRVEMPEPVLLPAMDAVPVPPSRLGGALFAGGHGSGRGKLGRRGCWRDKDDGLGSFTYVNRLKRVILQTTGMGVFGRYSSTAALASTTHIPAATQLVSPRNFMDIGSTAAAVAYGCSGAQVKTDCRDYKASSARSCTRFTGRKNDTP